MYTRARVFISSRNSYFLGGEELSDIRAEMREAIQAKFPFLDVRINEGWTSRTDSPREASVEGATEADLFIGILVADAGFADKNGLSATHEEFDAAAEQSRQKMLVFAETKMKDSEVLDTLPDTYVELFKQWTSFRRGKAIKFFEDGDELQQQVLDAVEAHCARAVVFWGARARSRSKTSEDSTWELMTFTERHTTMVEAFRKHARSNNGLRLPQGLSVERLKTCRGGYELALANPEQKVPVVLTACPDRFSYAEAAKFVGYPFRSEVDDWQKELGPLHVVMVYRTVTDTQIRRHLGNPDIHVSREEWGFFAADPERFIQVAYLMRCTDSLEIMQRVRDFMAWLDEYEQVETLVNRARVRGKVLEATVGTS